MKATFETPICIVCGRPLKHAETGRARRYCSNACRQKDYRERLKVGGEVLNASWRQGWLFSGYYDAEGVSDA